MKNKQLRQYTEKRANKQNNEKQTPLKSIGKSDITRMEISSEDLTINRFFDYLDIPILKRSQFNNKYIAVIPT